MEDEAIGLQQTHSMKGLFLTLVGCYASSLLASSVIDPSNASSKLMTAGTPMFYQQSQDYTKFNLTSDGSMLLNLYGSIVTGVPNNCDVNVSLISSTMQDNFNKNVKIMVFYVKKNPINIHFLSSLF